MCHKRLGAIAASPVKMQRNIPVRSAHLSEKEAGIMAIRDVSLTYAGERGRAPVEVLEDVSLSRGAGERGLKRLWERDWLGHERGRSAAEQRNDARCQ